ncbi:MAG: hypothetical protein AAF927_04550 [Bacteroidota bacterium]
MWESMWEYSFRERFSLFVISVLRSSIPERTNPSHDEHGIELLDIEYWRFYIFFAGYGTSAT